jgi:three-Cys-motif partner protein
VFVERDDERFAALEQVMSQVSGQIRPDLKHASLDECLPQILDEAKDAALFAFLDPFGPALDFQLVHSSLLGRPSPPPTEVLLHFSVSAVARMGGALRKVRTDKRPMSDADHKSAARLDRFLGGTWWQDHFAAVLDERDTQRATDAAMRVADRYRQMVTDGTSFVSVSMPVRPRPGRLPKYVLVLFTRHLEGVWAFADALGKAGVDWNEAWMRQGFAGNGGSRSPSLFDEDPSIVFDRERYEPDHRDQWIATIAGNIRAMVEAGSRFRIADRVLEVYGDTLGSAWIPHVRAAVQQLHREGVIVNDGKGDKFHYVVIRRP